MSSRAISPPVAAAPPGAPAAPGAPPEKPAKKARERPDPNYELAVALGEVCGIELEPNKGRLFAEAKTARGPRSRPRRPRRSGSGMDNPPAGGGRTIGAGRRANILRRQRCARPGAGGRNHRRRERGTVMQSLDSVLRGMLPTSGTTPPSSPEHKPSRTSGSGSSSKELCDHCLDRALLAARCAAGSSDVRQADPLPEVQRRAGAGRARPAVRAVGGAAEPAVRQVAAKREASFSRRPIAWPLTRAGS